jgi:acetylornithine deacetylase
MAHPMPHLQHQALDAAVADAGERAFAFLDALVRERSPPGAEMGAERVLAAELRRIGMRVERVPFPVGVERDPAAGAGLESYADRSIVVGRLGESGPGTLLLNGHLDVVPAGDERLWSSPPFEPHVRQGWMTGRGAGDMKAGLAMATLAIEALLTADPDARSTPLVLVGAIEEERSGNGTLASIRAGIVGDAAVVLEPTDLQLLVSGIGVLWFEVEVFAAAGHALAAGASMGALEAALRVIEELRGLEGEMNSTGDPVHHSLNIGTLSAGDWQSTIPDTARIGCRIGFPRSMTVPDAMARVQAAVARAHERAASPRPPAVRWNGFRAEGYDLAADDPLVLAMAAAHRSAHGDTPAVTTTAGTTDARFYRNQLGIPALCYGPRVENMHTADERVELASIVAGARTLARFLGSWGGRG